MPFPAHVPVLVVGAGPIGLAVAIAAMRRGLAPLVVDAGSIVDAIVRYPVGMTFFTTAERLEIGGHPFPSVHSRPTREEALAYYRGVVRAEGLTVRCGWRFEGAARTPEGFVATLSRRGTRHQVRADRIVLATGYYDHPNLLDVPGESLPHVSHWFEEPHRTAGQRVVIVGGKNSAIEAALLAWRAGARVTLVHRSTTFKPTVKYWLRPDFENRVAAGEITARLGWHVSAIRDDDVVIRDNGGATAEVPADRVYLLTGYHPDLALLRALGVLLDDTGRATVDPRTLESNVPGLHLAGSVASGYATSEVFIENGRFDGEKIFGNPDERAHADEMLQASPRPVGE
jgi:thioredoxin reductase (NADPH)